jgi:glycosyltransferase involved in cell wall biosynthesis
MKAAIAVYVHAEPARYHATLEAIALNTASAYELIVIPDGADFAVAVPANARVLDDLGARGGAACLNRLMAATDADVCVLLESGCIVAPRWLDHLLAAFERSLRVGVAGPSTNRFWNEQCAFPNVPETDVVRIAAEAERRFGTSVQSLAPLHSAGDFCYAVRREAFDATGPADESYGLGPCWEMDFNVRAARAGFDDVWVGAAFVWRAPFTARRAREEAARFEANKRRYQDKFCGARLRGAKSDYRAHCRGDACPNFAPRVAATSLIADASEDRLVSCIMPTHDRRGFIPQAIAGFLAQDYEDRELIVVDDGSDPIDDLIPADPRIRYFRLPKRLTVGAKRNFACERARGDIVMHWDDDDWYPMSRIRVQAAALRERGSDICGSSSIYFYDRDRQEAFLYRYRGGGGTWVAGTTLAYRRAFWERNRFTDLQVGEDTQFVWRNRGSVIDLNDPTLCVAGIHARNVSPKRTRGVFWSRQPVERVQAIIAAGSPVSPLSAQSLPLVSCVMPTFNRRAFIPLALDGFRRQTYPHRELIVIDDGTDSIGDLLANEPAVRYIHSRTRMTIGAKRNRACAEARGEIVVQWDDDDWYAADRIEKQVAPLLRGDADISGLENRYVLQMPHRRFWTVDRKLHRSMFIGDVHGGTLTFQRRIWSGGVHYPEINLAEDAAFLRQALRRNHRLARLENLGTFVYLRHSGNAWRFEPGKFLDPRGWSESAPPTGFPPETLEAYAAAAMELARQR